MYDIEKGELQSIHMNIFQEDAITSEITRFKIDKRHRKAYVANNMGTIYVINCQNGVFLKNVTQYIEDQKNIAKQKKERKKAEGSDNESLTSLGSSRYSSDQNEVKNLLEDEFADSKPKKDKKSDKKGKKGKFGRRKPLTPKPKKEIEFGKVIDQKE